jgi:hypothetical protein
MNESIVTTTMPTIARWRRSSAKKAGEYSEEDMVPHGIFEELISCSEMRPRAYTFGLPSPTNWDVWQGYFVRIAENEVSISHPEATKQLFQANIAKVYVSYF